MINSRLWILLGLPCLLLFTGCSDADAARIRKVGGKALDRAASVADDTSDKLKAGIHPLPKASTPAAESREGGEQ